MMSIWLDKKPFLSIFLLQNKNITQANCPLQFYLPSIQKNNHHITSPKSLFLIAG